MKREATAGELAEALRLGPGAMQDRMILASEMRRAGLIVPEWIPRNPADRGTRWLFGKPYVWAETDGGRLTLRPDGLSAASSSSERP